MGRHKAPTSSLLRRGDAHARALLHRADRGEIQLDPQNDVQDWTGSPVKKRTMLVEYHPGRFTRITTSARKVRVPNKEAKRKLSKDVKDREVFEV